MKAFLAYVLTFAFLCPAAAAPIVFEAEHANNLDAVFLLGEHKGCSGGLCVMVPDDAAEPAGLDLDTLGTTYTLDIEKGDVFDVWFRVYWEHACANSFFVGINRDTRVKVADTVYHTWHWLKGSSGRFEKGANVLALSNREDGMFIDQIALVPAGQALPSETAVLQPNVIPKNARVPEARLFFQLPVTQRFVWDGRTTQGSTNNPSTGLIYGKPRGREIFLTPDLPANISMWIRNNRMQDCLLQVRIVAPDGIALSGPPGDGKKPFEVALDGTTPLATTALRVTCTDDFPRGTGTLRIHVMKGSKVLCSETIHVTRPFDWAIAGPFAWAAPGRPLPDMDKLDFTAPWKARIGTPKWTRFEPHRYLGSGGTVDFLRALGRTTLRNAFACTRINVPRNDEYEFLISNDDQAIVWIDGRAVYKSEKSGPAGRSRRLVKVRLKKGPHTILVRVFQREQHWVFKVEPLRPAGITGLPFDQW